MISCKLIRLTSSPLLLLTPPVALPCFRTLTSKASLLRQQFPFWRSSWWRHGVSVFDVPYLMELTQLLTENALPFRSVDTIPWLALGKQIGQFVHPACLPFNLQTLNLAKMDMSDVYRLYEHIILLQESPDGIPFHFTIDNMTSTSLAPLAVAPSGPLLPAAMPLTPSPTTSPAPEKAWGNSPTDEMKLGRKRKLNHDSTAGLTVLLLFQ